MRQSEPEIKCWKNLQWRCRKRSLRTIEPLVKEFAAQIAEDSQRLRGSQAPLTAPLTDASQIQTIRRIREQVAELEKQLADAHQRMLNAAQAISLHWMVPGDVDDELSNG